MASAGNWFADEKEDTGFQTVENSKFFGIASSIESFSKEGKKLIIQQPETSYAAHTGQFGQIVGMLERGTKWCQMSVTRAHNRSLRV